MQNGKVVTCSSGIPEFVNAVVASEDPEPKRLLRDIVGIIQRVPLWGKVQPLENQELQKGLAILKKKRFSLPEEFALLASGCASDVRLQNTVVKLRLRAHDILARIDSVSIQTPQPPPAQPTGSHETPTPPPS